MHRLIIEKVDNGYIIKIAYPENRSTTVVPLVNKNTILDVVKEYLEVE